MKVYLGRKGLKKTWQQDFPENVKCHKCKGQARVMFVGLEESGGDYVCNLHSNEGEGGYWPHDCISCAVYLCKECFEVTSIINQA